jgi:ribonuclease H2 subunit A
MVYGCAYCPISRENDLKSSGYADSKTLTEEQREALFHKICACDYVGWSVEVISAARLSEHMLRVKKYNLNLISHDSAAGLVRRTLALGVNVCKVFVDTVGDPEKYQAKLSGMFPSIEFKVAKKADSLFPCVSAASICAKVIRDRDIRTWRPSESNQAHTAVALGSGYPADPCTKVTRSLRCCSVCMLRLTLTLMQAWLRSHLDPVFGFPRLVRFSWQTVTTLLLENGGVPMLVPADEEDAAESGSGWQRGEQTPKVNRSCTRGLFIIGYASKSSHSPGVRIFRACRRKHAQAPAPFLQPRCCLLSVIETEGRRRMLPNA